jgi:hypothetical protein
MDKITKDEAAKTADRGKSIKKRKGKSPAKQKRAVRAKRKSEVAVYGAAPAPVSGRWVQFIGAGETAFIADRVVLYAAIKNNGPSTVLVYSDNGGRGEKLVANLFRVIPVMGPLTIQTMDDEYAIVELEFIPNLSCDHSAVF